MGYTETLKQRLEPFLKYWYVVLILILLGILVFKDVKYKLREDKQTVSELAFNENIFCDNTVYIKENNYITPYIVLTSNYNNSGNTLVIRKYVLNTEYILNEGNGIDDIESKRKTNKYKDCTTSYYPNTVIDKILNEDSYIRRFEIDDMIIPSEFEVTNEKLDETEKIERRIFLLSAKELGKQKQYVTLNEGNTLSYFLFKPTEAISKILTSKLDANGNDYLAEDKVNSWTRSRNITVRQILGTVINKDGDIETYDVNHNSAYIRPAFCIPGNAVLSKSKRKVLKSNGKTEIKDVYYIDIVNQEHVIEGVKLLLEE